MLSNHATLIGGFFDTWAIRTFMARSSQLVFKSTVRLIISGISYVYLYKYILWTNAAPEVLNKIENQLTDKSPKNQRIAMNCNKFY